MRYIFYADVYFIQNFMIKVAVLYLSLFSSRQHSAISTRKGVVKIILAAFLGTIFEITGLIFGRAYNIFIIIVHLIEVPLMFGAVLGKERSQIIRIIITGYFFLVLINGVQEMLWNWFGEKASFVLLLIFACGAVIIGVHIWRNYSKMQKGIFVVEVRYHGKIITTHGFYDSGNRLIDPYTGNGVHIISEQLRNHLELQEETAVFVPYQALGNEKGILEVYYVDELIIEGEKGRKIIQKSPLGVTKDNLFEGKNYEIILNEEVF